MIAIGAIGKLSGKNLIVAVFAPNGIFRLECGTVLALRARSAVLTMFGTAFCKVAEDGVPAFGGNR
jgi:hypothetical protein